MQSLIRSTPLTALYDCRTVPQFEAAFPDEAACVAYLVARRWPEGVRWWDVLKWSPEQLRDKLSTAKKAA